MDDELTKVDFSLNEALSERERVERELIEFNQRVDITQLEISEIENNPVFITFKKAGNLKEQKQSINIIAEAQLERIKSIMLDKEAALRERNKLVSEAQRLQKDLKIVYMEAQRDFLPIFQNLSEKFTGLPVTIHMDSVQRDKKPEFTFTLEIGDSTRQYEHQLSESQRFFIDIALRMALVLYLSGSGQQTMMLIDTPEGSLDIAYEINAGEMLADFVQQSQQLILTGNINSSGLVKALAKKCGRTKFELHRMIDWANLSDVQLSHLKLFGDALDEIERQLEGVR